MASVSQTEAFRIAQKAIQALGCGYDVSHDLWFKSCKNHGSLIEIEDNGPAQDLVLPGNIVLSGVPSSVKCDKGDRTRFTSDVLSFNEMSEHFNQNLSITGKIPLGLFNSSFHFSGSWQKDASGVKALAFDEVFISLYSVQLPRTQLRLKEEVRASLPSSWDPAALASFVEKYGTHIIVGVTIGGKDAIYLKQNRSSSSSTVKIQNILKEKAKERFSSIEGRASREKNSLAKVSTWVDQNGEISEAREALAMEGDNQLYLLMTTVARLWFTRLGSIGKLLLLDLLHPLCKHYGACRPPCTLVSV